MKPEDIEAFCNVVDQGSITKAADIMYVTQGAVSKRIKTLEEELGVQLIVRKSGMRKVELTVQGEEFLVLARQWQALSKEFQGIHASSGIHEITIGSVDMLNCFSFSGLYNQILEEEKDIRLDMHTMHSREIYAAMEAQRLDLGMVNLLLPSKRLVITKLFTEEMYIVIHPCGKQGETVDPDFLDPEKEIYSRWSDEFEIWHDQLWPGRRYRMHAGTGSMVPYYLTGPGQWSICPASAVRGMMSRFRFEYLKLSVTVPERTFYLLEHRSTRESRTDTIERFKKIMYAYLEEHRPQPADPAGS
ncbi:MAG: LysR family transcriptional regulator [Solobacterium sp.]|nr:LysR family transcriptional regulator [Solobacterium sp.]